jgi:hypothetical protein
MFEDKVRSESATVSNVLSSSDTEVADWTVMAYLAGDNNLTEEMILTLQEMLAHDVWPRIKILAQLDPSGLGLPTQRYIFNTSDQTVGKEFVETYEVKPLPTATESNTGNPNALSGFVRWAVQELNHKAHQYILILSGHGSGSTEDFLLRDNSSADSLTIEELEDALTKVKQETLGNRNIDLLGMDCCFMSMVEVFYQIRDCVDLVVAAESMVPDFGWPYHRILRAAEMKYRSEGASHGNSLPAVEPGELAKIIVKQYIDFYSDFDRTAGRSVDLAAVRIRDESTELMENLAKTIKSLALELMSLLPDDDEATARKNVEQIHLAHLEAQTYKFDQFVDLRDLCMCLRKRFKGTKNEEVANACDKVLRSLEECVLVSGCSGFAYQHSYGLSIYFPWAITRIEDDCEYKKLKFNVDTGWADFLNRYLDATRREERVDGVVDIELAYEIDNEQRKAFDFAIDTLIGSSLLQKNLPKKEREKLNRLDKLVRSQLIYLAELSGVGGASVPGGSKYHQSRYHQSRWPGDRAKSVKNFTPVVGTAFWPDDPGPAKPEPGGEG